LADEVEILSLSLDQDGPSMVEYLVRSKPERTRASVVAAEWVRVWAPEAL
jgi:hypothetical protein